MGLAMTSSLWKAVTSPDSEIFPFPESVRRSLPTFRKVDNDSIGFASCLPHSRCPFGRTRCGIVRSSVVTSRSSKKRRKQVTMTKGWTRSPPQSRQAVHLACRFNDPSLEPNARIICGGMWLVCGSSTSFSGDSCSALLLFSDEHSLAPG